MALLKNIRNCQLTQCFYDTILLKAGTLHYNSCGKFSAKTYCVSTASRRNKLISDCNIETKGKNIWPCFLRYFSSEEKAPDSFSKFSSGIDLETLKEARLRMHKLKGKEMNVGQIVKEIVKERCDEAFGNLNAADQRKLKIAQLEHDVLYSQGYDILPAEEMTSEYWLDALAMNSNQRRRFFFFLQQRQHKKRKDKEKVAKSALPAEELLKLKQTSKDEERIFLRLYSSTVKRWQNHVLASSMQFGQPLVWDMDYCQHMNSKEIKNTASQLLDAYYLNRSDENIPFHLHFTNCQEDNPVYRYMQMFQQNDPFFMATVTPQSCVDIFDKEDLVYLSPHSPVVMKEFDPNAVYILGAFNDKSFHRPISYARAKEFGIKCMQLPLDQHVSWKMGSKSLTLNQMMMIFQAKKNKKTWLEALTALPTRKINLS